MNRTTWELAAVGVLAAMILPASVEAASIRTFVSAHGLDTNPCSVTSPCRTFAGALVNTLPGGEIYVLDTAGYGPVTINQAVSIVNQTSTAGATATSGNAITINAGATDKVVLRGLTIVGGGSGTNGVVFNSGGALFVQDCTISQFTFASIVFSPNAPSELNVSKTRLANQKSGGLGIYINPVMPSTSGTVHATVDGVEAIDVSQAGVFIDGRQSNQNLKLFTTIANSVMSDSATDGIHAVSSASGASVFVMVRDTTISNNGFALSSEGGATLAVGHSTISGNGQAFFTSSGAVIESYHDNNVDGNGALGPAPTLISLR